MKRSPSRGSQEPGPSPPGKKDSELEVILRRRRNKAGEAGSGGKHSPRWRCRKTIDFTSDVSFTGWDFLLTSSGKEIRIEYVTDINCSVTGRSKSGC